MHARIILCHRRQCYSFSFKLSLKYKSRDQHTCWDNNVSSFFFMEIHVSLITIWCIYVSWKCEQNKRNLTLYNREKEGSLQGHPQISLKPTSTSLSVNFVWDCFYKSRLYWLYTALSRVCQSLITYPSEKEKNG